MSKKGSNPWTRTRSGQVLRGKMTQKFAGERPVRNQERREAEHASPLSALLEKLQQSTH